MAFFKAKMFSKFGGKILSVHVHENCINATHFFKTSWIAADWFHLISGGV